MTDKELLELAAKAAGYEVRWHDLWECFVHANPHYIDYPQTMAGSRPPWVPLHDDGDALRLAVKLGFNLFLSYPPGCDEVIGTGVLTCNELPPNYWSAHYDDPYAATRRAIVRAAAGIGLDKQK